MPPFTGNTNQQYLISTMCITTALINTHNSYKIHSQISQIHEQNILQTQTHNLKSPIQPIILSHSHNKQTLNTEQKVIFQPQNLPNYSLKKPTHVFLRDFLLSPHGRNLRKRPSNPLQKLIFIRLQSYSLMNKKYPTTFVHTKHRVTGPNPTWAHNLFVWGFWVSYFGSF